MKDLNKLSATEAAALIAAREISSVELTRACLDRIRERNDDVRAWCHLNEEWVMAQAANADRIPAKTPLHGIPFGAKDIIDTKDFLTEYGSRVHRGRRPDSDAICISRMRTAGAVLLGKLVTTEYANLTPNETRHPFNLAHTPGGSSSGSAAAVADMQVALAFGTQSAGSLIRPAAFCGLFALKPTHGLVPDTGLMPLEPFFDTLGFMARSINDLQLFFGAVSQTDCSVTWSEQRQPKIALCRTHEWAHALPETRYVFEETGKQLSRQGIAIAELELPQQYSDLVAIQRSVLMKGTAQALKDDYGVAKEKMSPHLVSVIERGLKISQEQYIRERQIAEECRNAANQIFSGFDAIICPSTPGEAPVGKATGDPIFQLIWTLLGVPVLNLPIGIGPTKLPVGVQLIARRHNDANLLALGKYLMQHMTQIQMACAL